MTGNAMLTVHGLNAWYGAAQILYDLSFDVGSGEVVALMGRNGAGKSTTLKSIMGLVAQKRGDISFCGHDISRRAPYEIARLGLGFVPEDRRIFSDLTVLENLDVGRQPPRGGTSKVGRIFFGKPASTFPENAPSDGRQAPAWTPEELFTLFPNLGRMPDRLGGHMSGGEQQMLMVARTLMGNPLLVLLDEPSEGVAPVIVEQMATAILELKRKGHAIMLSEQNIHFAELVSDRVYVLEKGQIHWSGTMDALVRDTAIQRSFLTV
jgi:branched-chain amino acid transport system ATP-binding protein